MSCPPHSWVLRESYGFVLHARCRECGAERVYTPFTEEGKLRRRRMAWGEWSPLGQWDARG